jgi:hypothetical protein
MTTHKSESLGEDTKKVGEGILDYLTSHCRIREI